MASTKQACATIPHPTCLMQLSPQRFLKALCHTHYFATIEHGWSHVTEWNLQGANHRPANAAEDCTQSSQKLGIRLSTAPALLTHTSLICASFIYTSFIYTSFSTLLQVHPMIKTLGPLEDAPDLDSIAPVLQSWADLIRHKDNAVSKAVFVTLLYADTHCSWLLHLMSMPV